MKLIDAIYDANKIVVTATVNEDEYEVQITSAEAIKIVADAGATDSVIDPQNDNFYAKPGNRHSQVAYYDGQNNILYIGN